MSTVVRRHNSTQINIIMYLGIILASIITHFSC